MEALIVYGLLALLIIFAITIHVVLWLVDMVRRVGLADRYGQDIAELSSRLDALHIEDLSKEFEVLRKTTLASSGLVVGPDGTPINVCPDCGRPMRKRSSRHGTYFACVDGGCLGSASLDPSDANVEGLTTK